AITSADRQSLHTLQGRARKNPSATISFGRLLAERWSATQVRADQMGHGVDVNQNSYTVFSRKAPAGRQRPRQGRGCSVMEQKWNKRNRSLFWSASK
ncbi:MAG: hypothetical protein NT090_02395, partial [Acidobacteria bacterium]|nr:hypothetical protein [Acidobacteriota bacterium]